MPASHIVLFDIDGTLVRRAGPHHRAALEGAVLDECGLRVSMDGIPVQGMLDRDIIAVMMRNAGAAPESIVSTTPAIVRRAQKLYQLNSPPDLVRRRCPGVRPALAHLLRARIPLGLVTGNLSAIAWRKLERAGLARYFRFGAFAEEAHTRAELVTRAMMHARAAGWLGRGTRVALVGDHPNDILAAKLNGIRSIAVATGVVSKRELRAHAPDVLLTDLRCLNLQSHL